MTIDDPCMKFCATIKLRFVSPAADCPESLWKIDLRKSRQQAAKKTLIKSQKYQFLEEYQESFSCGLQKIDNVTKLSGFGKTSKKSRQTAAKKY